MVMVCSHTQHARLHDCKNGKLHKCTVYSLLYFVYFWERMLHMVLHTAVKEFFFLKAT